MLRSFSHVRLFAFGVFPGVDYLYLVTHGDAPHHHARQPPVGCLRRKILPTCFRVEYQLTLSFIKTRRKRRWGGRQMLKPGTCRQFLIPSFSCYFGSCQLLRRRPLICT